MYFEALCQDSKSLARCECASAPFQNVYVFSHMCTLLNIQHTYAHIYGHL